MDYDTYSANDAIGRVYVDLNPLLVRGSDQGGNSIDSGCFSGPFSGLFQSAFQALFCPIELGTDLQYKKRPKRHPPKLPKLETFQMALWTIFRAHIGAAFLAKNPIELTTRVPWCRRARVSPPPWTAGPISRSNSPQSPSASLFTASKVGEIYILFAIHCLRTPCKDLCQYFSME